MAYSQNAKEIVEINQSDCNMNQTVSAGAVRGPSEVETTVNSSVIIFIFFKQC